jgi:hypothetical protein
MSMTEQAGLKPERKRGVGFPQISLQDAVDAVVVAGQNGASHSVDAFAAYLGHQTANSGAFRYKLAALRDYGLISRGEKDRVTLSGLAQDLVMLAPEHYNAKHLLLTAFESCRLFGVVHADSAKNTPMEITRIRTNVVMRHGVAPDQADRFVDVFVKSAVFAGIAQSDGKSVRLLQRDVVFTGGQNAAAPEADPEYEDVGTSMPAVSGTGSYGQYATPRMVVNTMVATVPVALRQTWEIDGGELEFVVRTPKPLPPEIYALAAEMAVTAKKMAELLQPEPGEPTRRKVGLFVGDPVDDDQQGR